MNKLFFIFISALLLFSCTDNFTIKTEDSDARIVFAGAITNEEGPYFVRVSLSTPSGNKVSANTGIADALVIISDNKGCVDTLKAFSPTIEVHPKWFFEYFTIKKYSGVVDTINSSSSYSSDFRGVYYTTKIKGTPGNKYTLHVKYKDKIVMATDSMPNVAIIDSVKFLTRTLSKDGDHFLAPYIYFKEPRNEKNYYMMDFGDDDINGLISDASRVWSFSILDDEYLPAYVNGLNIDDGISPVSDEDFYYPSAGSMATIRLLSLSPGAYNFYKSVISQFENDGGAYTPSPTSPPSNLSGNALGFFRTSAVSERKVFVKE
ncbi:MAG: DUF4249 domain-containing protein [Paludibacter sp.]|nr:DUF4249 domain-containing protein [Paludibacter sp.]